MGLRLAVCAIEIEEILFKLYHALLDPFQLTNCKLPYLNDLFCLLLKIMVIFMKLRNQRANFFLQVPTTIKKIH
jgi:hypothetical protein